MLMQCGTIFLILISLTILSTATSNAAATVTLVEINPVSEKQYTPLFIFENISTVITGDPDSSITSAVPPTIKSYDVLEIDVPALQQQIQAGEKIPVRFRGISYLMAFDRNPVVPESGESIYNGNFLNVPHEEILDDLVRLSFSGDQFKGSVHDIRNDIFVYLIPVENIQPAHTLYYVYSSADETPTGARLDNDVWVMLPSGESKLRNELTPEEIEWYKNEQVNRENPSHENLSMTGPEATPLPVTIPIIAFGLCAVVVRCFRRK